MTDTCQICNDGADVGSTMCKKCISFVIDITTTANNRDAVELLKKIMVHFEDMYLD